MRRPSAQRKNHCPKRSLRGPSIMSNLLKPRSKVFLAVAIAAFAWTNYTQADEVAPTQFVSLAPLSSTDLAEPHRRCPASDRPSRRAPMALRSTSPNWPVGKCWLKTKRPSFLLRGNSPRQPTQPQKSSLNSPAYKPPPKSTPQISNKKSRSAYRHDVLSRSFYAPAAMRAVATARHAAKMDFALSLFGFDPQGDYHRLTRELATRRLNLALPRRELIAPQGNRSRHAHRRKTV